MDPRGSFATVSKEAVAKSKKALNHKDTKAQRQPFLFARRSKPGKLSAICCSVLFKASCGNIDGGKEGNHEEELFFVAFVFFVVQGFYAFCDNIDGGSST